ncbi:hypothetical protein [Streptomyces sp. MH60]|uniref:hypothetical protein n=1 Tax=Streptomyces sp. MH60 TaxID=1940758 RepID=UPI000CEF154E|nr:hypothetical protein [Streptomyces sp. MH60]PPS89554.1 hypothetical protein BZZ08_01701 [Streptomyces sp. MH60]
MALASWTDPRYADLVETYDQLRQERPVTRPCRSCLHGLGSVMMVDLTTRQPITVPCSACRSAQ